MSLSFGDTLTLRIDCDEMSQTEKLTYGGLPVTKEYLDQHRVSSDQEIYAAIGILLITFIGIEIIGLVVFVSLLVWG